MGVTGGSSFATALAIFFASFAAGGAAGFASSSFEAFERSQYYSNVFGILFKIVV